MDEIAELIAFLVNDHLALQETQHFSYQDVFERYTGLNPLEFNYQDYCAYALNNQLSDAVTICGHDHALWLDMLFSHQVQPNLDNNALTMVYGFPAGQSSLARINQDNHRITDRVEIFINGVELGNGYYELTDASEQEKRFDQEINLRQKKNQAAVKDIHLIEALKAGLPECSGMAIGVDRLLMLVSGCDNLHEVLAFPVDRA
jgi:elongation factor P--(R)-beta-lysine ligase